MNLKGKVRSGKQHFSWVLQNIDGLLALYNKKSGLNLFPGTLNLELEHKFSIPSKSIRIEAHEYNGTVSASFYPCELAGYKAIIIRTDKNESEEGDHSKFIVEIAAEVKLREALKLSDGDEVVFSIDL